LAQADPIDIIRDLAAPEAGVRPSLNRERVELG
jgi:hypothetical protein